MSVNDASTASSRPKRRLPFTSCWPPTPTEASSGTSDTAPAVWNSSDPSLGLDRRSGQAVAQVGRLDVATALVGADRPDGHLVRGRGTVVTVGVQLAELADVGVGDRGHRMRPRWSAGGRVGTGRGVGDGDVVGEGDSGFVGCDLSVGHRGLVGERQRRLRPAWLPSSTGQPTEVRSRRSSLSASTSTPRRRKGSGPPASCSSAWSYSFSARRPWR